jgi:Xaa-Pro aminopeptidase
VFPAADYATRLDRARGLLTDAGLDVMLLSVGADLPYLTGYEATPLERLTMLVLPRDGAATIVVPRLEAPRIETRGDAFKIMPWDETDDPVGLVAGLAGKASSVAVGDQTWSIFLLRLESAMPDAEFASATPLTRQMRMKKDPDELELLTRAAAATDRVVGRLAEMRFSGMTERQLAASVMDMTLEEGHDAAVWAIVASGPNGASPHHEPTDREIERGDAVVIDFGGRLSGYCSDTTRTFSVGEPSEEVAEAFSALERAQGAARAAVGPGVVASDVDAVARKTLADAGYGDLFVHRTGHGIGLEVHEHPYIAQDSDLRLEAGMTFSIEPGIYSGGSFGMRIEDIVACSDEGVDELNRSPRSLYLVE